MSDETKERIMGVLGFIFFIFLFVGVPYGISHIGKTDDSTYQSEETVETTPTDTTDKSYTEVHGTSDCTSDCSGHEAGYNWAEEHEICDTEYDNGNSESFNEGVRAWAEDNCYYSDGTNPI